MNPIEHVWDALGRRVVERQPPTKTLQELERALLEDRDPIITDFTKIDPVGRWKAFLEVLLINITAHLAMGPKALKFGGYDPFLE
ncbi:hypothetical protein TNCV_1332361 [Trichonephila clavipes]|nr:hypothetical protein TNCV_1332361 [Trichonephila clavipes]